LIALQDLFTEILGYFSKPSARLQLFTLLNLLSSHSSYSLIVHVLSKHQLFHYLLLSMLLDNSSTVCSAGLTFLAKSLPYLAVHAREQLRHYVPYFLAILARTLCWKKRYPFMPGADGDSPDPQFERELAGITQKILHVRPDLEWHRLEMTFSSMVSLPPNSRPFFSFLYYLYPSNVLGFLRDPVMFLVSYGIDSPYMESWKDAFDEDEVRRKSEVCASPLRSNCI